MRYKIIPYRLDFKFPFKLAHTTRDHTLNAYLELSDGIHTAYGEVVFPPYYPETLETFTHFMKSISLPENILFFDFQAYLHKIDSQYSGNTFAKAALDIALHNLLAKHTNKSIGEIYQIPPSEKHTSFTLGISTNEEMEEKLRFADDFQYIKLKVNQVEMARIINIYRVMTDKPFVVDANQGFDDKEAALEWCTELSKMGVAYFEQPFHKDDLISHAWLSERSPIPIIADESFQRLSSIDVVSQAFHGVNVKLMKCTGVLEAYKCLTIAKNRKLKTVLGCMSESSVAVDAAKELAPLADWIDLDGPYLIKNNPNYTKEGLTFLEL